jgi:hypothetical protein
MGWKETLKFQRDQFWDMRPNKTDLIMAAFSALFSAAFISAFWLLGMICKFLFP